MVENDEIRDEIQKQILEANLKRIVKNLTPKQIGVLNRLRSSNAQIATELGCRERTISQDLNKLYSTFSANGIINFKGSPRKRTMLYSAWEKIRKQYQLEITEILERHKGKAA